MNFKEFWTPELINSFKKMSQFDFTGLFEHIKEEREMEKELNQDTEFDERFGFMLRYKLTNLSDYKNTKKYYLNHL